MPSDPAPPPRAPELRTPRLLLRPLRAGDRDAYRRYTETSGEHLAPWQPLPPPGATADDLFDIALERTRLGDGAGADCRRAAFLLDDGRIAGLFNLNNIARGVFQNANAGWGLAADLTGRGLATEALSALLDLAFAPPPAGLGLHRVQANIMPANARSLALAARCGFRREGFAMAMLQIAGRWEDHVMLAKLADEHEPVYMPTPG